MSDVGARIEELIARIGDLGGDPAAATAEEIVRVLVEYYGEGLERIAELAGLDAVRGLAEDPQVAALLVLHGLHPVDVDTRIEQALESVRPQLGSHAGAVSYLGVDEGDVAHLRLSGDQSGCSSTTVRQTVEEAILAAAPELQGVEVETVAQKPVLQIGLRPGLDRPVPLAGSPAQR